MNLDCKADVDPLTYYHVLCDVGKWRFGNGVKSGSIYDVPVFRGKTWLIFKSCTVVNYLQEYELLHDQRAQMLARHSGEPLSCPVAVGKDRALSIVECLDPGPRPLQQNSPEISS